MEGADSLIIIAISIVGLPDDRLEGSTRSHLGIATLEVTRTALSRLSILRSEGEQSKLIGGLGSEVAGVIIAREDRTSLLNIPACPSHRAEVDESLLPDDRGVFTRREEEALSFIQVSCTSLISQDRIGKS